MRTLLAWLCDQFWERHCATFTCREQDDWEAEWNSGKGWWILPWNPKSFGCKCITWKGGLDGQGLNHAAQSCKSIKYWKLPKSTYSTRIDVVSCLSGAGAPTTWPIQTRQVQFRPNMDLTSRCSILLQFGMSRWWADAAHTTGPLSFS